MPPRPLFFLTALILHYPGLRWFYGVKLNQNPWRANLAFLIGTAIATAAVYLYLTTEIETLILTWTAGHLMWGLYLFRYFIQTPNQP